VRKVGLCCLSREVVSQEGWEFRRGCKGVTCLSLGVGPTFYRSLGEE
jgi:hypothetical protein